MRQTGRVLLAVVLAVALVLAAAWLGQRRLVYFPDRTAPADTTGDVELTTSDGLRLAALLVRPTGPDRKTAVLFAHGNAGHRADRRVLADALAAEGLTVLVLGYRGYGGNPGSPTEAGLARDARAGLAHLTAAGYPPERIVYAGESLGAAVVTELATAHRPAALVLRSPFASLAAAGREHYPWLPVGLLLRDRFAVADRVAGLDVPTIVVYGTADTVVPAAQSREVATRAAGPVQVVELPGADHNDPSLTHGPAVVSAIAEAAGAR